MEFSPGLEGVPVARSKISYVDGQRGILEYRGIRIDELAQQSTFTEAAFLLLFGALPTTAELQGFEQHLATHRRLKYRIIDLLKCLPEQGHPMESLQAGVAALGMFYPAANVLNPETQYWSAVRLLAKLPTIVAAYARLRRGDDAIVPRDTLSHVANFLYILTERIPDPHQIRALETCFILHAEHTMNASTFSGLVTASTLADPYTVVASAIGTLRGPLHGGAVEQVIDMLEEIGSAENVQPYLEAKLAAKQKIVGLGHRIYKVRDPRAAVLQQTCKTLASHNGASSLYAIAEEVERVGEILLGHRGIRVNVDFYSGIIYHMLGIEPDLYTCIFATARVAGWLAHWIEQLQGNRLFRPEQLYIGHHHVPYTPIGQRHDHTRHVPLDRPIERA